MHRTQITPFVLQILWAVALGLAAPGCKSRPLGPYTSPRVTGQVLDAHNRQPLAGVSVIRGAFDVPRGAQPKGAELLIHKAPARTDANGRFELESERVLSLVRGSGWNTVMLSFARPGYWPFQTNFPISIVTNLPGGEPLLDVGRIYLQPVQ